jgi:hypothetical protein
VAALLRNSTKDLEVLVLKTLARLFIARMRGDIIKELMRLTKKAERRKSRASVSLCH